MKQTSFLKKSACLAAALLICASAAFATTPTPLTTQVLVQNNGSSSSLATTYTACDATNGNSFVSTGREVLQVLNSGGSSYTFTVTSVTDGAGRLDTALTAQSVAAGATSTVQMKWQSGWIQGDGTIHLTCSNVAIKFAVLQTN